MTERARDKDGKRQEREGGREAAGRDTQRTAGRRDRETGGEGKGSRDTERGREKERKAAEKQRTRGTLGTGQQRTRERQRWSETGRRETAKAVADRWEETECHSLVPVKAVRPPGPRQAQRDELCPHLPPLLNTWPACTSRTLHTHPHLPVCLRWGSPVPMSVPKHRHLLCVHPSPPISLTACLPSKCWGPCLPLSS